MYVARRRVIPLFNPRGQLFDQRDRQIPGAGGGLPQRGKVDFFVPAALDDGIERRLRHEAAFDLGANQSGLKVQHPLHPLYIAEPVCQRAGTQHRGQQTHYGSLNAFNYQRDPLTNADTHSA